VAPSGIESVVTLGLGLSSSEVAVSTSLRSCVKKDGSLVASCTVRDKGLSWRLPPLLWRVEFDIDAAADEGPGASRTLLVRGRFNFRSGSFGGSDRSAGDAVTDLDLRFRLLGLVVSNSLALSKAPQA
jgi:hypothetical protein